jgi:hypothetical protein
MELYEWILEFGVWLGDICRESDLSKLSMTNTSIKDV